MSVALRGIRPQPLDLSHGSIGASGIRAPVGGVVIAMVARILSSGADAISQEVHAFGGVPGARPRLSNLPHDGFSGEISGGIVVTTSDPAASGRPLVDKLLFMERIRVHRGVIVAVALPFIRVGARIWSLIVRSAVGAVNAVRRNRAMHLGAVAGLVHGAAVPQNIFVISAETFKRDVGMHVGAWMALWAVLRGPCEIGGVRCTSVRGDFGGDVVLEGAVLPGTAGVDLHQEAGGVVLLGSVASSRLRAPFTIGKRAP